MTDASALPPEPGKSRLEVVAHPVARRIVEYWLRHPHASDTAQGIREWWLGDEEDGPLTDRCVNDVLVQLVACGVAERTTGGFGHANGFRCALPQAELSMLLARFHKRGAGHG